MKVTAATLILHGASATEAPASFDCSMRQLAYKYGKGLLPRLGEFSSLYYALNLNDPACPTTLEPSSASEIVQQLEVPADAIYVDAENGKDSNSGSAKAPLKSITSAIAMVPTGTVVLREGTFFLEEPLLLEADNSGLSLMAYPGEHPVISGGKKINVEWTPYNVSDASGFEVFEGQNAVHGGTADDVHIHDLGKQGNAQACQDACEAYSACRGYTWHDKNQGSYANFCWGRVDGEWPIQAESGHTSGRKGGNGMNIYSAKLNKQVADVPGLQLDGARATRARYPNLPGGLETSPGYGGMISGGQAAWTPPDFDKYGPVTFHTDNQENHTRNDTPSNWFQHYMVGTNGLCSVYDPPVGYWCSEHPSGGGAFAFRTPSGVTPKAGVLPNSPYKDVSEMIINIWRPNRWANWMFKVGDYDAATGNFTFGEGGNQGARGNNKGGDFFIENVFEELDHAGEFFYDKKSDELYLFHNGTGAPPANMEVVVPSLKLLLNVSGSQFNPVRNVTVDGITFKSTSITYMDPHGVPSAGDWALERTGAVFLEGTESLKITSSTFERLDGNAVMISGYNRYATIQDSDFSYIGGNSMVSWGYTNETENSGFPYYRPQTNFPAGGVDGTDGNHPRYNQILRNNAREIGLYEKQSSFYMQAKTAESTISGNAFFNGPRAGINFNDGFGGADDLNNNLVFSACRESGDHGPFNSWDRQPYLTTVRDGTPSMFMAWRNLHHNFFIDNYSPQEGVDNDDGSMRYYTHDNFLVYGGQGMKTDFGGHDNHHFNNIYAYVGRAMGVTNTYEGHEDYFYGNKVVLTRSEVGGVQCSGATTKLYNNSYFTPDGKIKECGGDLPSAQAKGFDKDSTVATIPEDDAVIGWAAELLSIQQEELIV